MSDRTGIPAWRFYGGPMDGAHEAAAVIDGRARYAVIRGPGIYSDDEPRLVDVYETDAAHPGRLIYAGTEPA